MIATNLRQVPALRCDSVELLRCGRDGRTSGIGTRLGLQDLPTGKLDRVPRSAATGHSVLDVPALCPEPPDRQIRAPAQKPEF